MINFELYKVFYLTAQLGSLSKAAKALYITQPSVSHAIKQLEEGFGLELFSRTSKGVVLTKEGQVLHSYVEQAFNFLSLAEDKMAELKNLEGGELRIGGSDSLCKHYLLPYLEVFHAQHPNVKIHLVHGTTPEIVSYLKEGKIDLGVVRMPVNDIQLEVREGILIQDCFVAGSKYRELSGQVLSLEKLLDYPIILFSRNSHSRYAITGLFRDHGLVLAPEFELGSVDLLIEFAKTGLGISYVTKQFVRKELEEESLFEIKLDVPIPQSRVGIITLKNMPLTSAASAFIDRIPLD
ncbi:LysR family transcriptional regulator [Paenibacillus sambharensis]|uniref:LysR family transcriptional regulator n=1 Tax=Paenibacillus sambharensis TaxID=1803190 RepID=A0A2W1LP43_9BACL|nr:LysR family transcriptional regulator [Paenibacillus sambharensis]PZD96284.1 LysR family transcriptional regulator [Paenibacillus sambharensis]